MQHWGSGTRSWQKILVQGWVPSMGSLMQCRVPVHYWIPAQILLQAESQHRIPLQGWVPVRVLVQDWVSSMGSLLQCGFPVQY